MTAILVATHALAERSSSYLLERPKDQRPMDVKISYGYPPGAK
jgi:hypothetical protein